MANLAGIIQQGQQIKLRKSELTQDRERLEINKHIKMMNAAGELAFDETLPENMRWGAYLQQRTIWNQLMPNTPMPRMSKEEFFANKSIIRGFNKNIVNVSKAFNDKRITIQEAETLAAGHLQDAMDAAREKSVGEFAPEKESLFQSLKEQLTTAKGTPKQQLARSKFGLEQEKFELEKEKFGFEQTEAAKKDPLKPPATMGALEARVISEQLEGLKPEEKLTKLFDIQKVQRAQVGKTAAEIKAEATKISAEAVRFAATTRKEIAILKQKATPIGNRLKLVAAAARIVEKLDPKNNEEFEVLFQSVTDTLAASSGIPSLFESAEQALTQQQGAVQLPEGVSQEDFDYTLTQHPGMTAEELIQQLQGK